MAKEITDYKKWILTTLLDKYEESTAFQTGIFKRRIMLSVPKERKLQEALELIDEKHLFLSELQQLKDQGLIDYSWVKYEKGNLVDKIWLVPETLNDCYKEIHRISCQETLDAFIKIAISYLQKFHTFSDFAAFVEFSITYAQKQKKIHSPFTDDMTLNRNLLECLAQLDESPNQLERVFSSRLFGDSKYFERTLKSKIVSILKEIRKAALGSSEETTNDGLSDDDLLAERGLYRYPEIYEFKGAITITLDNGIAIETSSQIYGAYINSDTVKHIASIDGSNIQRVVFIENKANYIDYQSKHKKPDDLIVFHGGFYSPMKGVLLTKIYEGCTNASFYHWSDIDLGGFRIFNRLRKHIAPSVQPLFMDATTLQRNVGSCMEIKTDGYLQQLSRLLDNPEYFMFFDVIKYMIDNRVRLEQENLIQ